MLGVFSFAKDYELISGLFNVSVPTFRGELDHRPVGHEPGVNN